MKKTKFKKGDVAYTIENFGMGFDNTVLVECVILNVTSRDRIIDYSSEKISKKRLFKVVPDFYGGDASTGKKIKSWYPEDMACISYVDPFTKQPVKEWKETCLIKKDPQEFFENQLFIDMSKSVRNFELYD